MTAQEGVVDWGIPVPEGCSVANWLVGNSVNACGAWEVTGSVTAVDHNGGRPPNLGAKHWKGLE